MRLTAPLCVALFGTTGAALADQLPGTLNFNDVTGDRINQTVAEADNNEKAINFGDFDKDGDLDVVIAVALADFGAKKNKLYRNDDGVFNEVSGAPIISGFTGLDVTREAFFFDIDGDEWLDLWVVNDGNSDDDIIYIAQIVDGEFSHFQDMTSTYLPSADTGASCSATIGDYDDDNDMDIWVGNYPFSSQDRLYRNNLGNSATNVTGSMVPSEGGYTVDCATADLNGDGKLDVLVSNHGANILYYNDNNGAGSQVGDFSYTGSTQNLGNAGAGENAMEPGDFDNDGKVDIYWSNLSGATGDRILRNTGNNEATNKAEFETLSDLPSSVLTRVTRKVTVADLNADGRQDIFVMFENPGSNRPVVLRNTTVNGEISFVDWTPGHAFPTGSVHKGWHANVFDSNNDGDLDVFLGGFNDDHLFESVPANELSEEALGPNGGPLPALHDTDPVAVLGTGTTGEVDEYDVSGIESDSILSIVLNGPADYELRLLNEGGTTIATSNRGGEGVEEAIQHTVKEDSDAFTVRVTTLAGAGSPADLDGSGSVDGADLGLLLGDWGPCRPCDADLNGDGNVDGADLGLLLGDWGAEGGSEYVLEVLSRSGP